MPDPHDSPALRTFRAELRRVKGPMTFGLSPLIEAFERLAVDQSRQICRLDGRCRDLERTVSALADALEQLTHRVRGLDPADFTLNPDGTLTMPAGRHVAGEALAAEASAALGGPGGAR